MALIPNRLLMEWAAYYSLEPWGEDQEDRRAAMLATLIANSNRDKKTTPKAFQMSDFMPPAIEPLDDEDEDEGEYEDEPTDSDRLLKKVEMLNTLFGGKDKRVR